MMIFLLGVWVGIFSAIGIGPWAKDRTRRLVSWMHCR